MLSYEVIISALLATSQAATVRVDVGASGKSFSPSSVTAQVGDSVDFHFGSSEHSVVMSDFSNPCKPAASGGFYSGFPTGIFRINVTTTEPMFYYCSKGSHCSGGMVGVINPSSGQTLDAYRRSASGKSASAPASSFGGQLVPSGARALTAPMVGIVGAAGAAVLLA